MLTKASLIESGQEHLFANAKSEDEEQLIIDQLSGTDRSYPGGIARYVVNTRALLQATGSPFAGYKAEKPSVNVADVSNIDEYLATEAKGKAVLSKTAFMLVAGGLGERLGYPDIKVNLFTNMIDQKTYLQYYCECIKTFEQQAGLPAGTLVFSIMTSDDTKYWTELALEENDFYGLQADQVYILKQEKVPAIADNEARIAIDGTTIVMKPHGHGDVHLLAKEHMVNIWNSEGIEYVFFFQDTNALSMRALQYMLGTSEIKGYDMNTLCVTRFPQEAVGAICRLVPEGCWCHQQTCTGNKEMTCNVEYNQLGDVLPGGDVPEDSSASVPTSPFPGNTNILLLRFPVYEKVLEECDIPEFINPKYTDSTKTAFKSPARPEGMMQDIARHPLMANHGATVLPRSLCFTTCKNMIADAVAKQKNKNSPECGASAEFDLYNSHSTVLDMASKAAGVPFKADACETEYYQGVAVKLENGCVYVDPEVGPAVLDVVSVLKTNSVKSIEIPSGSMAIVKKTGVEILPRPRFVELTPEQMADETVDANLKVRGYSKQ